MSFLTKLIREIDSKKAVEKETKSSPTSKLYDFEKTIREMAKAQGIQPRTFLIKMAEQNPKIARNPIVQKLIGEQDVPTQKGRDAKPKVLTKRAMNVVKKGIKQAANKQRRRMDKDSVGEDVKDQFTKLINPMGQDSTSLEKIKQSPGFHKLISTMFASGTQADMEWDEIFSAMSKMLNMNPIEIKAILQQDGFEFVEPDAAERFKQNMGGTGFLGKGKSKTLNSMYEGSLDQFRNLYKKSIGSDDAAVTLRELIQAINDDALWSDQFPQLKQFTGVSPLSGSRIVTAKKIPGDSADEKIAALVTAIDDDEWVNDTAKHLMRSFTLGEDEAQDRGYAQMIIQQHQDEYKKFMDTGDLMDAPAIYEKLFAYFSSSDADDQMPYGTQKARDGDPYVWLVDKLDELGLIIEEGNEFAQKVRQLKATGAKKGTKFKTSDGEEHTLEGDLNAWYAEQYAKELAEKDGKTWDRMPYGDKEDYRKIANKKYGVVKSEDVSDKKIDSFHNELDRLVHKYFGHSPDEKKEKAKEKVKENDDQGEVRVGSYQTKHFDICPSATKLFKDIDVDDMDLAERSAKLHDTLFYMEKHAMEMEKAEPEYIEMMQNLADQIMAMASMMGLESEHSYVQGHVDAVKDLNEAIAESKAITEQEFDEAAGKKDACYHKVKARYKVWPSAYASGALVQCRKKGAANWGNKSK